MSRKRSSITQPPAARASASSATAVQPNLLFSVNWSVTDPFTDTKPFVFASFLWINNSSTDSRALRYGWFFGFRRWYSFDINNKSDVWWRRKIYIERKGVYRFNLPREKQIQHANKSNQIKTNHLSLPKPKPWEMQKEMESINLGIQSTIHGIIWFVGILGLEQLEVIENKSNWNESSVYLRSKDWEKVI